MPSRRFLEARHEAGRTVVRFTCDSLTEYDHLAVSGELARLTEKTAGHELVLDLGGVRYASSAALDMLLRLRENVRASGGRLVLANPLPMVDELLAVTRLKTVFEVSPAGTASSLLNAPR